MLTKSCCPLWKNVVMMDPSICGKTRWLKTQWSNFYIPGFQFMTSYCFYCSLSQSWSRSWKARRKPTLRTSWDYCASFATSLLTSEWSCLTLYFFILIIQTELYNTLIVPSPKDAAQVDVMNLFPHLFGCVYILAKHQGWNSETPLKEMFQSEDEPRSSVVTPRDQEERLGLPVQESQSSNVKRTSI